MNDRVLVTGISGFLGGHVALGLLQRGFRVRGSVRDLSKAAAVRSTLARAGAEVSRLEFVALDLLADSAWRDAVSDCRYVQHIASPFVLAMPENADDLIRPAVEGTRRALSAAFDVGVERVVLTSSVAAIDGGHADYQCAFGPGDWTQVDGPRVNAYARSKTLAEREAWKLAGQRGASTRLAVIHPGTLLGPLLDDDPGTSAVLIQRLLRGDMPMLPRLSLPYVDVRDVAAAHIAAMSDAGAAGTRSIVTHDAVELPEIARLLRQHLTDRATKVPTRAMPDWLTRLVGLFDRSLRDSQAYLGVPRRYDGTAARRLLGRPLRWTSESLVATAESLIARNLV